MIASRAARVVFVVLACIVSAPGWAQGRMLCESYADGNWDLMILNADGTGARNLTNTPDLHELYPHASPDGSRIAFVVDTGEGAERQRAVWMMNVDGSGRTLVAADGRQPCWSPDGTRIAYLGSEFDEFAITDYATRGVWIYSLATGDTVPHPNPNLEHLYNLCWAAGGEWLLATVHAGMGYDHAILAIEADGERVVELGIPGCRPDVSPDGRRVAWGSTDWDLCVAELDLSGDAPSVSNERVVVHSDEPMKVYHVDWSPDGTALAFSRGPTRRSLGPVDEIVGVVADGWDIYTVPAEGGEWTRLTTDGASHKEPDWVPGVGGGAEVVVTEGGVEMVRLPGGEFLMGSEAGDADERPTHRVRLDAFLMDRTEVTQASYAALALADPSHFKGDKRPVEQVSWAAAATYCNLRSRAEGLDPCYDEDTAECDYGANGYRLPTEAEWEYACRAGSEAAYCYGDDAADLARYAWFEDNSGGETHPVASLAPNAWGLFDLHGNVAEWCNDMYDAEYYGRSPGGNPPGPEVTLPLFVLRGGSWSSTADECRSARRLGDDPGFQDPCYRGDHLGFRCVRRVP